MKKIYPERFNILGVNYDVIDVETPKELADDQWCAQYDVSKKKIKVALKDSEGEENSEAWLRDSFLHELAHVFLYETGNADLNDERHVEVLNKFFNFAERVLRLAETEKICKTSVVQVEKTDGLSPRQIAEAVRRELDSYIGD